MGIKKLHTDKDQNKKIFVTGGDIEAAGQKGGKKGVLEEKKLIKLA